MPSSKTIYDLVFEMGSGQVSIGRGLGIIYGDNPYACPKSWLFIDNTSLKSAEELKSLVEQYKKEIHE